MAGIYIHIPFCKKACHYCNFHFSTQLIRKEELFEALLKEIELQKEYLKTEKVQSIYLGGGTPSLLSIDQLNQLYEVIEFNFKLADDMECTLEANPDDLSINYLRSLRRTFINRLSIGVQTFYDEDLQWMNRSHDVKQAEFSIKATQDLGFRYSTIDLIYGYPGLTKEKWVANLNRVTEYQIQHFSAYCLTVEEETALHHQIRTGKQYPMDEDLAIQHFEILLNEIGRNDWFHYEISNIATAEEFMAFHNPGYWRGVKYLGIGPSAHSFNGETRQWNVANNALYIKSISNDEVPFEIETLTNEDKANEYIMTSLRTIWGCDLSQVTQLLGKNFNSEWQQQLERLIDLGYIAKHGRHLHLNPHGQFFADQMASNLFFTE